MPGVVSERKKQSIRNRVLWSRGLDYLNRTRPNDGPAPQLCQRRFAWSIARWHRGSPDRSERSRGSDASVSASRHSVRRMGSSPRTARRTAMRLYCGLGPRCTPPLEDQSSCKQQGTRRARTPARQPPNENQGPTPYAPPSPRQATAASDANPATQGARTV